MSYLATGDVTPSQARVQAMTTWIISRRNLGQGDDVIRAGLRAPGPLPLSNPCAGANGQNVCAEWEITQAFGNATLTTSGTIGKVGDDGGGLADLLTFRNLAIAGAVIAAASVGYRVWKAKRKGKRS